MTQLPSVTSGDPRVLAKVLTTLESGTAAETRELVKALSGVAGRAHVIGITGPPGAGKSTLVGQLIRSITARGDRIAVVASDPSSPLTGGAVLGDRLRMQHDGAESVFIRSMASRDQLGGISAATPFAVLAFDAAGFDFVVVETVGVGQSEVDVFSIADTNVVLVAPGAGDAVQLAKAGVLETADIFVINKSDVPEAKPLEGHLRQMLETAHITGARDEIPIVRTVATTGEGADALLDTIVAHRRLEEESGSARTRSRRRARFLIELIVMRQLRSEVERVTRGVSETMAILTDSVARREVDVYTAADQILAVLRDRLAALAAAGRGEAP